LFKMMIIDSPRCNFCNLYEQTTPHLFYSCLTVKTFWYSITEWLHTEHNIITNILLKDILFGHQMDDHSNLLNIVIFYARLYIMNCKVQNKELKMDDFNSFFQKQLLVNIY